MREGWDDYFLGLATYAAQRSTCDRLHVGAIIVRDNRVLATGYNGSLPGMPHCDDVGHLMDAAGGCIRTTHAEVNAVAQAARYGSRIEGATCYVTHSPCVACYKMLVSAGITRIVCGTEYRVPLPAEIVRVPLEIIGGVRA